MRASRLLVNDPIGYLNSTFLVRLQTHLPGSKTPIGMFQDVAGTIPATQAGDKVRFWTSVQGVDSGGLLAFFEATNAAPTLQFVNGYPVVRGNGTNSILTCSGTLIPMSMFAVAKGAHDGAAFGRLACDPTGNSGVNDDSFAPNEWAYRFNGTQYLIAMTTGYDALGMQGAVGNTQTSINGVITTRADGSMADTGNWTLFNVTGGGQAMPGDIVSVIFGSQAYNPTDWAAIDNYQTSLKP